VDVPLRLGRHAVKRRVGLEEFGELGPNLRVGEHLVESRVARCGVARAFLRGLLLREKGDKCAGSLVLLLQGECV